MSRHNFIFNITGISDSFKGNGYFEAEKWMTTRQKCLHFFKQVAQLGQLSILY